MKVTRISYALLSAMMLAGAVAPSFSVLASTQPEQESTVPNVSRSVVVSDPETKLRGEMTAAVSSPEDESPEEIEAEFTLEELFNSMGVSAEEREQIVAEILTHLEGGLEYRARYYKSYQTITASQVKAMVNGQIKSHKAFTDAISNISKVAAVTSAVLQLIYAEYDSHFKTAAKNGWGIKITLTIDSYNPTSTGMSWTLSYIK